MKYFKFKIILFFQILIINYGYSQFTCYTPRMLSPRSTALCPTDSYNNFNTSGMRDRVLRVTIHVFQKADGSGNFDPIDNQGNPTSHYNVLKNMVYDASSWMSHLNQLILSPTTPHMSDTRIRYDALQILEWKDDAIWALNSVYHLGQWYNFISNKPGITYMNNSIHLFIHGQDFTSTASEGEGGVALSRWQCMYGAQYLQKI